MPEKLTNEINSESGLPEDFFTNDGEDNTVLSSDPPEMDSGGKVLEETEEVEVKTEEVKEEPSSETVENTDDKDQKITLNGQEFGYEDVMNLVNAHNDILDNFAVEAKDGSGKAWDVKKIIANAGYNPEILDHPNAKDPGDIKSKFETPSSSVAAEPEKTSEKIIDAVDYYSAFKQGKDKFNSLMNSTLENEVNKQLEPDRKTQEKVQIENMLTRVRKELPDLGTYVTRMVTYADKNGFDLKNEAHLRACYTSVKSTQKVIDPNANKGSGLVKGGTSGTAATVGKPEELSYGDKVFKMMKDSGGSKQEQTEFEKLFGDGAIKAPGF